MSTDHTLAFESALAELIDLMSPGLESGDLLDDAKTAGDQAYALRAQTQALITRNGELVDMIERLCDGLENYRSTPPWGDDDEDVLTEAREMAAGLDQLPTPSPPLTRPAVPEGWKLVPVEPTFLMEDAGISAGDGHDWSGPVAVYAAMIAAAPQPEAQPIQYLQESDQQLLHRFIETAEDDESFDIGMPAVNRLADLGVVRNCGFGRYAVTMFGYWVHEHFWHQNPPLPLMTNADRNAAHKTKLIAQKGGA